MAGIMRMTKVALTVLSALTFSVLTIPSGWAQQKVKISYKVTAANSKYTQQHVIDVGDIPGHQIRVYELYRTFPSDAPVYEGLRMKEQWTRAISDYTNGAGPGSGYGITVFENGDKVFSRFTLASQSGTAIANAIITGGTGKFVGIRGTSKSVTKFDLKAGTNETEVETEYWIEK
jgi:hypothetical protein